MSRNVCIFIGRLGDDLSLEHSSTGTGYAKGGVAVNNARKDKDGKFIDSTTWVNFTVFGKLAEAMVKYTKKGDIVVIQSRYDKSEYTADDGEKRYSHTFIVEGYSKLSGSAKSVDEADSEEVIDNENLPF